MSSPSTVSTPRLIFSRWFTQRRNVDLPDPEGPMITATSPRATSRSIPRSTSLRPKRLCTFDAWSSDSDIDQRLPAVEPLLEEVLPDRRDARQHEVPQRRHHEQREHLE